MAVGLGPADGGAAGEGGRAVSTDADEERSVAAVERSVGESRICPRCGEGGTRGLWRYLCKSCGRTFNALNRPAASGAAQEGTLAVVRGITGGGRDGGDIRATLRGIVEADETHLLRSRKGEDARAVQGFRAGPVRRGPVGRDSRRGAGLDAG